MRAARRRAMQAREELRTGLDLAQQPRQRRGVADREIAGIVAAEQADRAVDARGQHRHAGGDGFGYDVGAALAERRQHHGPRAAEQAPDLRARPVAAPEVAWIGLHLGLGAIAAHCGVSAAPRCTMRMREVAGRRRAASAARNGSFTSRRCPITATSKRASPSGGDAAAEPTGA